MRVLLEFDLHCRPLDQLDELIKISLRQTDMGKSISWKFGEKWRSM